MTQLPTTESRGSSQQGISDSKYESEASAEHDLIHERVFLAVRVISTQMSTQISSEPAFLETLTSTSRTDL